jgi:hypothetical protein
VIIHVEARTSPANDDHHVLYFATINNLPNHLRLLEHLILPPTRE